MHGQRRHRDVHLAADGALFGVVGIQAAMGLLMAAQIRTGGVIFAAFGAGVFGTIFARRETGDASAATATDALGG